MRPEERLLGPTPAQRGDIDAINHLFAEAFTERYRRDGLTGTRIPWLNRSIWEYAIAGETYFSREIGLTLSIGLGDLSLLYDPIGGLRGFALWQDAALVRGQHRGELRVLKLGAVDRAAARDLVVGLEALGSTLKATVSIRCETRLATLFSDLIQVGYRVSWTDLRLTLDGHAEHDPGEGVLLSNWEI